MSILEVSSHVRGSGHQYMYGLFTGGFKTFLSRLSYLILYMLIQWFGCTLAWLYLVVVRYQVPCVLGAHDECYINYVYLYISSPYINPNMNSTPVPEP